MDDLPKGTRLPLGTRRKGEKHPSNGGRPYSQDYREQVLEIYLGAGGGAAGLEALRVDVFNQLRAVKKFPCMGTCRNYIHQWHSEGNILAKIHTGNKFAQRKIHGDDLFNLALYRIAFPKAIGAEVRAFIYNRNPNLEKEHSPSQLSRAEKRLGLSLKVGSTTSKLAYLDINLLKREDYWFNNYPFGIANINTEDIIDIDEAQFKLTSQDRKYGKAATNKRVDSKGMYKKGASAVTLILGISASEHNQFSFAQQCDEGTTDLAQFYTYMQDFIDYLVEERPSLWTI